MASEYLLLSQRSLFSLLLLLLQSLHDLCVQLGGVHLTASRVCGQSARYLVRLLQNRKDDGSVG